MGFWDEKKIHDHMKHAVECGECGKMWCGKCDPAGTAWGCHWCHGRGDSDFEIVKTEDKCVPHIKTDGSTSFTHSIMELLTDSRLEVLKIAAIAMNATVLKKNYDELFQMFLAVVHSQAIHVQSFEKIEENMHYALPNDLE